MIPRQMPDYVERGGGQVHRPPYVARNADLYGFAVTGDPDKIDDLLDRDLNEPACGEVHYRCVSDTVFLTFANITELTSVDPPDSNFGFVAETELSIWCLAADVTAGNRLVWYLPYVFTDSGEAIATGREVYGYPKQSAIVTLGPPTWSADAWAVPKHGPRAKATQQRVVTVANRAPARRNPARPPAAQIIETLVTTPLKVRKQTAPGGTPKPSATLTGAATPAPPPANAGGGWLRAPLTQVLDLKLDKVAALTAMAMDPRLVFLKQFRDVECPTKACYQAIVEAGLNVDPAKLSLFELLEHTGFKVTVENYDSHPIGQDLGIAPAAAGTSPCTAAFHASVDFTIQTGFEVWRAPA